jgi:hypothetical protein
MCLMLSFFPTFKKFCVLHLNPSVMYFNTLDVTSFNLQIANFPTTFWIIQLFPVGFFIICYALKCFWGLVC